MQIFVVWRALRRERATKYIVMKEYYLSFCTYYDVLTLPIGSPVKLAVIKCSSLELNSFVLNFI